MKAEEEEEEEEEAERKNEWMNEWMKLVGHLALRLLFAVAVSLLFCLLCYSNV